MNSFEIGDRVLRPDTLQKGPPKRGIIVDKYSSNFTSQGPPLTLYAIRWDYSTTIERGYSGEGLEKE